MNRLTYKLDESIKTKYLNYEYGRIKDHDIMRGNLGRITDDMIFNKLGQLEDIEEENGLDLITLFKALKQKHVFHKENVKIELLGLHIKSNELYLYGFVEDTTHTVYLSLKDYGETWALTREELEDDK